MKLFAGLGRSDYQDLLRAIGALLDERGLSEVRLWEQADGLVVQGRRLGPDEDRIDTVVLSEAELRALLAASYDRRGQARPAWLGGKPDGA